MSGMLDTTVFDALGTTCAVKVVCAPVELPLARMAAFTARAEVERCERVLSRFDPTSDLARVNASPGAWTPVDPLLVEAVELALRFERETDGRCSPRLLGALTAAGYDRSFEELGGSRALPADPGEAAVDVDPSAGRVRVSSALALDLGGTAKGLIATRALRAVERSWPSVPGALVDLGGDVAVTGEPPAGGPWVVEVADPRADGVTLGALRVDAGGVATSGPTCRRFGPAGSLHHLIDPATRAPAVAGPLAATVVAPDPAAADAHATALALCAVDEATEYVAERPELGAVLVLADGPPLVLGSVDFTASLAAVV